MSRLLEQLSLWAFDERSESETHAPGFRGSARTYAHRAADKEQAGENYGKRFIEQVQRKEDFQEYVQRSIHFAGAVHFSGMYLGILLVSGESD